MDLSAEKSPIRQPAEQPHPRVFIVNPNTSDHITSLMVDAAIARAAGRATIIGTSAPFGAASLECEAELVIAAHAVLETIATAPAVDAFIIGAFGDPGRSAAAQLMTVPVLGLAQSGMMAAAKGGHRFAILTLGPQMEPLIRRAADEAGFAGSLVHLGFLPGSILAFAADRNRFMDQLVAAAHAAIADHGAEAILFGGAPFAGIGDEIGPRIPVPVFDGLTSAVDLALERLALPRTAAESTVIPVTPQKPYIGLSPELARLIAISNARR